VCRRCATLAWKLRIRWKENRLTAYFISAQRKVSTITAAQARTAARAPAARIPAAPRSPRLSPHRADGPVPLRCRGPAYAYSVKYSVLKSLHDHRRGSGAGAEGGGRLTVRRDRQRADVDRAPAGWRLVRPTDACVNASMSDRPAEFLGSLVHARPRIQQRVGFACGV
jgi:hypothetical protein